MQVWGGMDDERWWWREIQVFAQQERKWKLFRIRPINTAAVARQAWPVHQAVLDS